MLAISMVLLSCSLRAGGVEGAALRPYAATAAADASAWPPERLVAFLRELVDFVFAHHVVTDPRRAVYGMTYEFWQDGKRIQAFGLDSMHDGAWFLSALAMAHRADPDGGHLARALRF
ncbi:MAG: hypothetical protein JXP34_05825 [Planctomycetes bacterium]|nr:hypothetical protein [Planctomycetota bacterium]